MKKLPPASSPIVEEAAAQQQLRDSHFRSILKAVTWRVIGTIDTFWSV